jgi:hypothetical protein
VALPTAWDRVDEHLRSLAYHERLGPTIAALRALVAELRREPRLAGVDPSVSLASLNLKLPDTTCYVMVAWHENEPQPFGVSFIDPPLEFRDIRRVSKADVVATVIDYLDRLGDGTA